MKKDLHFPNLTEMRGVAAMAVLCSHLDQFHYVFNYDSFGLSETGLAEDAVNFFFVLSGFLITYLLLNELKNKEKLTFVIFT